MTQHPQKPLFFFLSVILILTSFLCVVLPTVPTVKGSLIVDDINTRNAQLELGTTNNGLSQVAFQFNATANYIVTSSSCYLNKTGNPTGNIDMELYNKAVNGSMGTLIAISTSIDVSTISGTWTWFNFTFSSIQISLGHEYWVVINWYTGYSHAGSDSVLIGLASATNYMLIYNSVAYPSTNGWANYGVIGFLFQLFGNDNTLYNGYLFVSAQTYDGKTGAIFIVDLTTSAYTPTGTYEDFYVLPTDQIMYTAVVPIGACFLNWTLANGTAIFSNSFTDNTPLYGMATAYIRPPSQPMYNITSIAQVGSMITPSGVNYYQNYSSQTYNFWALSNYQLGTLLINNTITNFTSVISNNHVVGTYTFNNITGNSTIEIGSAYVPTATVTISQSTGGLVKVSYVDAIYGLQTFAVGSWDIPIGSVITLSQTSDYGVYFKNYQIMESGGNVFNTTDPNFSAILTGNVIIYGYFTTTQNNNSIFPAVDNSFIALIIYIASTILMVIGFFYLHNNNIPFAVGLGLVVATILCNVVNLLGILTYPIDALTIIAVIGVILLGRH